MPALKHAPGTIAGEVQHPQMLQVLGDPPGVWLEENIEFDEGGLAAQLLYLELVQEAHPDFKSFPKGSAFELSVADEVLAARHVAVCHSSPGDVHQLEVHARILTLLPLVHRSRPANGTCRR